MSLLARKAVLDDVGDSTLNRVYSEMSLEFFSTLTSDPQNKDVPRDETKRRNSQIARKAALEDIRHSEMSSELMLSREGALETLPEGQGSHRPSEEKKEEPTENSRSRTPRTSSASMEVQRAASRISGRLSDVTNITASGMIWPSDVARKLRSRSKTKKLTKVARGRVDDLFQAFLARDGGQISSEKLHSTFQTCFGDVTNEIFTEILRPEQDSVTQQDFVNLCERVKGAAYTDEEILGYLEDSLEEG